MFKLLYLAMLLLLFEAKPSYGMPVYAVAAPGCRTETGAIVNVDQDSVSLLTVTGKLVRIPRATIEGIAEYYVVENPIARFPSRSEVADLYQVATEFYDKPFIGYAVGFVDQTALFFDQQGRIRVVEIDQITALRKIHPQLKQSLPSFVPSNFEAFGRAGCDVTRKRDKANVGLEKIYGQGMQATILLNRMQDGYQELTSLAERTSFFYRPLVFDQKTRIGVRYAPLNVLKETSFPQPAWEQLPIYFSSSAGRPYRFQTHFEVGTVIWDSLPFLRPTGGGGSFFKSHLIHGELILNFDGFSAGKPVFANPTDLYSYFDRNKPRNFAVAQSFNHLTLLGLDYSSYSFSFGSYYPTFAIRGPLEYRGITPPNSSLLARVSWHGQQSSAQLLLFNTDAKGEGFSKPSPDAGEAKAASDDILFFSNRYQPHRYTIKSQSARLNGDFQIDDTIRVYSAGVYSTYQYKEEAFRRATPLGTGSSTTEPQFGSSDLSVSQTELSLLFGVHLDLSKWVALGGEVIYKTYDSHASGWEKGEGERADLLLYHGMFEILL